MSFNFRSGLNRAAQISYVLGVLSMVLAMSLSLVNFPVMAQNESGASLTVTSGCNGGCNGISAVVTNHGSGDMTSAVNYEVQSRVGQDWVTVDSGTLGPLASGESQTISYNPNNVGGTYRFKIWQPAGHPGTGVLYSQACKFECALPTSTPFVPTPTPVTPTATFTPTFTATFTPTQTPVTPTPTEVTETPVTPTPQEPTPTPVTPTPTEVTETPVTPTPQEPTPTPVTPTPTHRSDGNPGHPNPTGTDPDPGHPDSH